MMLPSWRQVAGVLQSLRASRLVVLAVIVSLTFDLAVPALVLAQAPPPPPPTADSLHQNIDELDSLGEGLKNMGSAHFNSLYDASWDDHVGQVKDIEKFIAKSQTKYDLFQKIGAFGEDLGKIAKGLKIADILYELKNNRYVQATGDALSTIAQWAAKRPLMALAFGAADAICGVLTAGTALPWCVLATGTVFEWLESKAVDKAADAASKAFWCGRKPDDPGCQEESGAHTAASGSGAPGTGGGGGSGSSTINVVAGDINAVAAGGGQATNQIAACGTSSNIVVNGVTTVASGTRGMTSICGNAVVTGQVVNLGGGTVEIGTAGVSSDGRPCIDIYRETCIVMIYPKPPNKPCAPGWWLYLSVCELPWDLNHKFVGMGHW